METESGTLASIPLGEFLMTEEPVWVWDASAHRILWANQAGRRLWGASSLEDVQAKRFSPRNKMAARLKALASQPGAAKEWVETLRLDAAFGRTSVRCQLQGLRVAGGRPGLIVKALNPPFGRNNAAPQPARAVTPSDPAISAAKNKTAASDKTALKAITTRLKQERTPQTPGQKTRRHASDPTALEPERVELMLREFCHEMRNPLSVIAGFAQRIKDIAPAGKRPDQLRAYADDIIESADLAMAILGDFSANLLCPESPSPAPERIDVRSTVESCLRLIAPLANQSDIRLYRRVEGRLSHLMVAERVMKQVLLNLLMNAIRHHKTGGSIKVTARQRKDGTVRLTVGDDGKGMTKKEIKAALSPSSQASASRKGRSGLGLPLVKRLVENSGGELTINSQRGKGTTVEIVFPVAS